MERLTEHSGDSVFIKGCKTLYANQGRKGAPASNAIVRLAAYEDTGLSPEEIKALIAPLNDPLTLNELRKMDGDPVYVRYLDGAGEWGLVETYGCEYAEIRFRNGSATVGGRHGLFSRGAEIYRCKTEGEAK